MFRCSLEVKSALTDELVIHALLKKEKISQDLLNRVVSSFKMISASMNELSSFAMN